MKWVYIKNGDVAAQLKRLENNIDVQAGPDAFLADFLRGIKSAPAQIISWCPIQGRFHSGALEGISYQVAGSKFGRIGNSFLRFNSTKSAMLKMIRFHPQRIICGRIGPMLWMTVVVSKLFLCPFIHSRHNSLYEGKNKWHQKLLAKLDVVCIRQANAVICHGPFLCTQMEEIGVNPDNIIEFDVAFSNFNDDIHPPSGTATDNKTILFIGRVARNKGVFDLLSASEQLLQSNSNIRLKYIGDGPDLHSLQEEINKKGLSGQVACLGRVNHSDLPSFINASYVVVTPTRREFPEGRCLAAMEALACAVPLIAPASGPFPYLVDDNINGMLFEPDSVASLSQALTRILNDVAYYQQVKQGAVTSAIHLRTPIRTFYQAVEIAFNV